MAKDITLVSSEITEPLVPGVNVPANGEIHTIEAGSMDGHTYSPTCTCGPTMHPEDMRIWTHKPL